MKKILYLFLAIIMSIIIIACNSQSNNLQLNFDVVTNTSPKQSKFIRSILKRENVVCKEIILSNNPILLGMPEEFEGFDIIGENQNEYILILEVSNKDFVALLDSEQNILYGILDSWVLPKFFE